MLGEMSGKQSCEAVIASTDLVPHDDLNHLPLKIGGCKRVLEGDKEGRNHENKKYP
jgi:hypothetical protein